MVDVLTYEERELDRKRKLDKLIDKKNIKIKEKKERINAEISKIHKLNESDLMLNIERIEIELTQEIDQILDEIDSILMEGRIDYILEKKIEDKK